MDSLLRNRIVVGLFALSGICAPPALGGGAKGAADPFDPGLYSKLAWRNIGPARGGRSVAVAGVPGQPLVYYMGGTGGGVWKTVDAGRTWKPIADKYLRTGSVGAIAVARSDPNVVYVGMGEVCVRGNFSHGDGVYKSTDAGKTWKHVGLSDTRQIGRIHVHPKDADLVYVAALGHVFGPNEERGVFRSKDGGRTWERVLYVHEKAGAVDLAMDMTNPRILYAAFWQVQRTPYSLISGGEGSGLYKSTDGGDTWKELSDGLPEGLKGRIGVAVSPGKPDRVWAIVEAEEGGIFRSDNGGESFRKVNDDRMWRQRAWYYTHVYADPQDAETVYVLNVLFGKSTDGGKTFSMIRVPHGDNHDLWIAPEDNQRMINANDGGANVSFNGGESWSRQDNQPTAQFYHVAVDNQFPYRVYGAQQDNSTVSVSSEARPGSDEFYPVGGGESGYVVPHPQNPDIVYAGSYGGYLTRYDHSKRQLRNIMVWPENPMGWGVGELRYRFQWTFPIVISPHDANTLYVAANVLFKSTNEGQSWEIISPDLTRDDKTKQGPSGGPITHDNTGVEYYCTIFAVAESPHEAGVIWAGSDDGLLHVTRDGGENWEEVTPPDAPKWALMSQIDPSPHEPGTCYVAVNAYKSDDFSPYIFKTDDYGKNWGRITNGIASDAFVRVVREDPVRKGLLYAGTETGVYVSFDDGGKWQSLQQNLPVVPITDLVVKDDDLVAATQGRSFWIFGGLSVLRQLGDEVMSLPAYLFVPTPIVYGEDRRVDLYYHLSERAEDGIKLEFVDPEGEVIRTFTHEEPEDAPSLSPIARMFGARPPNLKLSTEAGMNKFELNTRYPDATEVKGAVLWAGSTRGPAAAPGEYTLRLSVGEHTDSKTLRILTDPRTDTPAEDYASRFDYLIRVRDELSEAHDAINLIREIKEQAAAAVSHVQRISDAEELAEAGKTLAEKLSAIEEELIQTKSESFQDPLNYPVKLNNKIASLAGAVRGANFAPTQQALDVLEALSTQLQIQLDALEQIVKDDVPAFNQMVREHDVPAIAIKEKD